MNDNVYLNNQILSKPLYAIQQEKSINRIISVYLQIIADKLLKYTMISLNKYKKLKEEMTEIIKKEKEIKVLEIGITNKREELINFEKRMKEKNIM